MSDHEDLLSDDLGDHSLADYNLGNEEEEQLLADDYDSVASLNVPSSSLSSYNGSSIFSNEVPTQQPIQYHLQPDTECVVPNITVEIPSIAPEHSTYAPYEPPPQYEPEPRIVPPAIPAAPIESPQIVPSEIGPPIPANGGSRTRFVSERPVGAQRIPQHRDIPDSLDKVVVPGGRGGVMRGRGAWRNHHYTRFHHHPYQYRRNNMHRGNFMQRASFPPPQVIRQNAPHIRPDIRPNPPQMRPDIRPNPPPVRPPEIIVEVRSEPQEIHPEIRPEIHEIRPELRPELNPELPQMRPDLGQIRPEFQPVRPDLPPMRPELPIRPDLPPELRHEPLPLPQNIRDGMLERPMLPNMPMDGPFRPMDMRPEFPRFPNQFRPHMEPRHDFGPIGPNMRPNFEHRPMYPFHRPFRPFIREPGPPIPSHIPQVTIRQPNPIGGPVPREAEVRMLAVQLPPNLPPGGLQGKKVLINPHFKGNFQPPVEGSALGLGLPAYIPTRIHKSPPRPPLSPTLEDKFGPIKDIDDAAERFIAEQRNALARAANRKFPPPRRSPTRYIENTTIEIENELAGRRESERDSELLRKQEEFINANRAGLRRRMRSASPPRRSPSPRRSPDRPDRPDRVDRPDRPDRAVDRMRVRVDNTRPAPTDEESEYRRRMREQESLRERVLRAKEARRRRNANQDRERERLEKEPEPPKETKPPSPEQVKPDTSRTTPDKEVRDRSPVRPVRTEEPEVNSTCENLTPPRPEPKAESQERLTPPLPVTTTTTDSDDDLDLILGDIDGILSDDDDTGRFKEKSKKPEPPRPKPVTDLRSKLPPKHSAAPPPAKPKQRITFHDDKKDERKNKEKTPPRRTIVTSSTKTEEAVSKGKMKEKMEVKESRETKESKPRQRITFNKDAKEQPEREKDEPTPKRRVILQRKTTDKTTSVFTRIEVKADPTKPHPAIFSRAVRTAIGTEKTRIVVNSSKKHHEPQIKHHEPQTKHHEPQIEYESDSDIDEDKLLEEDIGYIAIVTNLPHGMTDTRLKTLAGNDVQSLNLDKEDRSAKITFKSTSAAETFKKKFNNKMVAASRLSVSIK